MHGEVLTSSLPNLRHPLLIPSLLRSKMVVVMRWNWMADRPYASGVSCRAIKRLRRKETRRDEMLEASRDVKPLATDPTEADDIK